MKLEERDGRELISLARECIESVFRSRAMPPFPERDYSPALRQLRSAFVTLRTCEQLRGCCGSIEPTRPLAEEIWQDALASAFRDPRFPPLSAPEWPTIHLHVSVLEPPRPIEVASEEDLIARLRPGIDGLVLQCHGARATFLPSVWEDIQEPREFVRHLKAKAGWSESFWSPNVEVAIYEVEKFDE
jgi:AmmeMemoRadiSam system protein A